MLQAWSQYGSTYSLHTPEDALFVYECVEMELGLSIREDEKKYSCPVHLHLDRGNSSRYDSELRFLKFNDSRDHITECLLSLIIIEISSVDISARIMQVYMSSICQWFRNWRTTSGQKMVRNANLVIISTKRISITPIMSRMILKFINNLIKSFFKYFVIYTEDADLFLPKLSDQSSSQYLVCTRTKSTQDPAPILGFGLLQEPCILIALLHTGVTISLSVVDLHYLLTIKPLEMVISPGKKVKLLKLSSKTLSHESLLQYK